MKNAFLGMAVMASVCTFGQSKFAQLEQDLPTPNTFRTASGSPGPAYYQQQADYVIKVQLDETTRTIRGEEVITYTNNSPDPLPYLWIQLDQNMMAPGSMTEGARNAKLDEGTFSPRTLTKMTDDYRGGFDLQRVTDGAGKELKHTINYTMMRVDLPKPLLKGQKTQLKIQWSFAVNDRDLYGGRSGLEFFPKDSNDLYTIAQFFPRMAVYSDNQGWQNKQFLGGGEFTLPFGNYDVSITVPADHIVAATGTLQNAGSVLTATQQKRFKEAATNDKSPVLIVTPEEAREAEQKRAQGTKTWRFKAENVRDFAFASSRKFIWDAMAVQSGSKTVLAMSFYPNEGNPLWEQYSTRVVAHTLRVYGKHTFDYPYPVAISVHTKNIGMEYPMICFNGGRPEPDGTYSEGTKNGMISVIIHEVGHNFFPMIVNSDERQWTWMDEGLNTFLQFLAEQAWDRNYASRRGFPEDIVPYMAGPKTGMVPIMTNSESLLQFGNNAYGKPATALNILRETVMGRELFDFAFAQYSQKWMFKHPTPADFFRTMEDASAVDLDWFWRGWFYSTDHVDIALKSVRQQPIPLNQTTPDANNATVARHRNTVTYQRNLAENSPTVVETDSATRDFYNTVDRALLDQTEPSPLDGWMAKQPADKQETLKGLLAYELVFENAGGLIMPIVLKATFADGTDSILRLPAEVWLKNEQECSKVFYFNQAVQSFEIDPFLELADTQPGNNSWPAKAAAPSRFEQFRQRRGAQNPMQQLQKKP
jgi:hypothetical protein